MRLFGRKAPAAVERVVPGTIKRVLRFAENLDRPLTGDEDYSGGGVEYAFSDIAVANLVTSEVEGDYARHAPVLDLDIPATLVPSTTPGHSHLYLDVRMPWRKYKRLLNALADAGVIEPGYAAASIDRGYSAVRPPWVRKVAL